MFRFVGLLVVIAVGSAASAGLADAEPITLTGQRLSPGPILGPANVSLYPTIAAVMPSGSALGIEPPPTTEPSPLPQAAAVRHPEPAAAPPRIPAESASPPAPDVRPDTPPALAVAAPALSQTHSSGPGSTVQSEAGAAQYGRDIFTDYYTDPLPAADAPEPPERPAP